MTSNWLSTETIHSMSRSQVCMALSVLPDTFVPDVRLACIWVVLSTAGPFPVRPPSYLMSCEVCVMPHVQGCHVNEA